MLRVYTTRDDAGSSPACSHLHRRVPCTSPAPQRPAAAYHHWPIHERKAAVRTRVRQAATLAMYAAMLIAVLALWNNDAPSFIYVAF